MGCGGSTATATQAQQPVVAAQPAGAAPKSIETTTPDPIPSKPKTPEKAASDQPAKRQDTEPTTSSSADASKPCPRVVILGPPASGKGAQTNAIRTTFGVAHVSSGECLRAAMASDSALGRAIASEWQGGRVSDTTTVKAVLAHLEKCKSSGFLLDGFPRTTAQAKELVAGGFSADRVVVLSMPSQVLIERQTGRRIDPTTKTVYHIASNPPKDEMVKARLITRQEDEEKIVTDKIQSYFAEMDGVVSALSTAAGVKVQTFDASMDVAALSGAIKGFISA